jgi:hypothetical protein
VKHVLKFAWVLCVACGSKTVASEDAEIAADVDAMVASDGLTGDVALDVPGDVSIAFPELQPTVCMPSQPIDLLGWDPKYVALKTLPQSSWSFVQDNDWYLLTVLQQMPEAKAALLADPTLAAVAKDREVRLRGAALKCVPASTCLPQDQTCAAAELAAEAACLRPEVAWTPDEITTAAAQVGKVLAKTPIAQQHLRPSGRYALYVTKTDEALITAAMTDALNTLQGAFGGIAGDHPAFLLGLPAVAQSHPDAMQFFEPLLWSTIAVMKGINQDQAGRYEPLTDGENKAALERLKTIDWSQWRFSVVLGLGWGPEDDQPLSPLGREHCDVIASRYLAGLAPFILVSGGHVHPSEQTPYAEALEMKKYLMAKYQIPENAILVDPHARHTTTNLRNVARQMMEYGIPLDKPGLYSSDVAQVFYVLHLDTRCMEDMGFVPYRTVQSLGENDNCFLPSAVSMFRDARDQRDP